MPTPTRAATFNVNQFDSIAHAEADLLIRMATSDVLLLQETVKLDLNTWVKAQDGWGCLQFRNGTNDGHANTSVLRRDAMGKRTSTAMVPLGRATGEAKDQHTRIRCLVAEEIGGRTWFGSFHGFPARDATFNPALLQAVGAWVEIQLKAGKHVVLGCDKNQIPVAHLERHTGLKWHGVGIDGLLVSRGIQVSGVHEFRKGFSDHPGVHAAITLPAKPSKPTGGTVTVQPPSPKYLGPAAHTSAGDNKPINRIVIHSTVSACKPGGAEEIAAYFRSPKSGGSAHYVVDPAAEVQVVYDGVIAWHAPPNPNSLGIEMCDTPGPVPNDPPGSARFKAAKRAWRWVQPNQQAMLKRTARLTAQLCAAYDVPTRFLSIDDLKAGKHGITTHNNVSQAFHQSTHWDPGFWPRRRFMRLVRKYHAELAK